MGAVAVKEMQIVIMYVSDSLKAMNDSSNTM